ncbi:MAG: DUF4345 domain-containing protein [Pseudomonadota bacterium]
MQKRPLQILTALLGAVPILTGIIGLFGLSDPLYASAQLPANALLDSNLRFLSGVWLGVGLTAVWLIPRIETHTVLFRALWGMIFLGGVGRLLSMVYLGWPPVPFIGFAVLEIVGAPIFVIWQARLGKQEAMPMPAGETACHT